MVWLLKAAPHSWDGSEERVYEDGEVYRRKRVSLFDLPRAPE